MEGKTEFKYLDAEDLFRKISMALEFTRTLVTKNNISSYSKDAQMGAFLVLSDTQQEFEVFKEYYWNKLDRKEVCNNGQVG